VSVLSGRRLRQSITPTSLQAECETCRWGVDTGRYDADRMAARRHAERNPGHVVRVETSKVIRYCAEGRS
jgi:predicted alpha/beta-hydrolase family hydrolase